METANYQLYVTDDATEKFKSWREKMNGTNDSNMVKIDDILSKKAENSKIIETVLSASSWTESVPYTQTITVEGLNALQNGMIGISQNITNEQFDAACNARLYISGQNEGNLIISASGTVPTCDIPVTIIIIG